MPNTKGTDVVALRKIFRERGGDVEKSFLDRLPEELQRMYKEIVHTTWSPVEKQAELYAHAAEALFPGNPDGLRLLGQEMARRSYSGVYRIFLRLPTVDFIINRVAQVWGTYYDQGEACIEDFQGQGGVFVVRNFPELPRKMREVICGHLTVILEATGAHQISVTLQDQDPKAWRWRISWT